MPVHIVVPTVALGGKAVVVTKAAVTTSAATTDAHTAIVAGTVAGAISGGSTSPLIAYYVGTAWGRKILNRVLKKLSIQELDKLAQAVAKTVSATNAFCQATDTSIREVGLLALSIQQEHMKGSEMAIQE